MKWHLLRWRILKRMNTITEKNEVTLTAPPRCFREPWFPIASTARTRAWEKKHSRATSDTDPLPQRSASFRTFSLPPFPKSLQIWCSEIKCWTLIFCGCRDIFQNVWCNSPQTKNCKKIFDLLRILSNGHHNIEDANQNTNLERCKHTGNLSVWFNRFRFDSDLVKRFKTSVWPQKFSVDTAKNEHPYVSRKKEALTSSVPRRTDQ